MQIKFLKKLWSKCAHNAFTDLCEFNGQLFCCFREARNHVSDDGTIRIIKLDDQGHILTSNALRIGQIDLRDPKLSVTPDGKLLLLAYGRNVSSQSGAPASQSLCWVSSDGLSWSGHHRLAEKNWWLWRLRWFQNKAYGFAYNRSQNAVNLYSGDPRRSFHMLKKGALSLASHGKGYPNESDLVFTSSGTAYALIRRDADSYSAQLGVSKPPYKQWQWQDLGFYLGGPVMLLHNDHQAIVAGRILVNNTLRTGVLKMDLVTGHTVVELLLPSAGDNSYPGLVIKNKDLYLSYYSCHEQQKSCIYLACINLEE